VDINSLILKYDKSDYLRYLREFSRQIALAQKIDIPKEKKSPNGIIQVAALGMGGSAIGADLVRSIYEDDISVPFSVVRNYRIPASVSRNSLVIASSYSGNTEETLSAYTYAKENGANIICITSGGELGRLAKTDGFPVIMLPGGYQPRAALGFSLIPILHILAYHGIIQDKKAEIYNTISLLKQLNNEYAPDTALDSAPLKLAEKIHSKLPLIYTGPAPFDTVGIRWRCQFAENAKMLAYSNTIPEMNHNEIMGWDRDFSPGRNIYAVFLRDNQENDRIQKRFEISKEIISKYAYATADVWSSGSSKLARAFSLLYFGDYVSYYCALLNKKDPTVIENINYLKTKLSNL